MRKENSDFVTEFITSPGDFKKNGDYFAFVELDDKVCWVLADGLDSAQDVLSAKLAAGSVISDFTENPSLKKKDIKQYLTDAHQFLRRESRMMNLKVSLLVVVSDYSSLAWGSIGNTRLYHLRKEAIIDQSWDNSVAQMMVEVGDIAANKLNQHEERHNLTEYLGQEERIKPNIERKKELKDDDVLLMCTAGFWENIADQEIEDTLKESQEAKGFVENLEKKLLSKDNSNLDNYSLVSIFANKTFQQDVSKGRFSVKKIALILIPLCLLLGGILTYGQMKQQAARLEQKKERQAKIKKGIQARKKADKLFKQGKYKQALSNYQQAQELYKTTNQNDKQEAVSQKSKVTNKILTGRNKEKEGDQKFAAGNYQQALTKYKKAKLTYLKIKDYDLNKIEDKISRAEDILEAKNYALEGNMLAKSEDYAVAKEKYLVALEIYKKNGVTDRKKKIENKIKELEKQLTNHQKVEQAEKIAAKGDRLKQQGNHEEANLKYMKAKVIYSELGKTEKANSLKTKINKLANQKLVEQGKKYKQQGFSYFQAGKYEKALFNYNQAQEMFAKANQPGEKREVETEITKVKKQQAIKQAKKYEQAAQQQVEKQNYEQALKKYKQAKQVYTDKNLQTAEGKIDSKLDEVHYKRANYYENLGNELVEKEKYEQALDKYEKAKKIYIQINYQQANKKVRKKIKEVKEKKDKAFFFF